MQAFEELMLDVWREVGRHETIQESVKGVARILGREVPLEALVVRCFESSRHCVETVAASRECGMEGRTECSRDRMRRLGAWCKEGRVDRRPPASVTAGFSGEILAGPLKPPGGVNGAVILVAKPGARLETRHIALVKALLSPLSVALENDMRLREMLSLREAAEAERQALLNRLGRKDLGDAIVGADEGLRLVMGRVELVTKSDVPVLILGETGTGKELVARAIHRGSNRANGPIIRVNCGAIPPELIDSQLFGHEHGAFTGANETHKGWFERADGGTLFLDEIGELPLPAQVRLLRILQDGWLERIGGRQAIHVDVRIVASTHRDLAAMVADGQFREDLWYRIAVFPILLPPLRERTEDIPALARHFAERAAVRFGLPELMPTDKDLDLLAGYAWPGNVRELAAVMDRAALVGNGRCLEIATALGINGVQGNPPDYAGREETGRVFPTLEDVNRRHIQAALKRTQGIIDGKNGAAKLLGVNGYTLRGRMRKLGLNWSAFREDAGE